MEKKSHIETLLTEEVAVMLNTTASGVPVDEPLHELGIDSFTFVQLLVIIEKKLNVNLFESGITREDFQSIHTLASHIEKIKQE